MWTRLALLLVIGTVVGCTSNQRGQPAQTRTPVTYGSSSATDSVIVPGACPFECCQYGNWELRTVAALKSSTSASALTIAHLTVGTHVHADSGIVVMSPAGLVVATRAFQDVDTRL